MHSVGMEQKQVKWNVSNCLFNQYMVISDPRHTESQSAQISQMQDEYNVYAIMKTMCPPGHHHNGFVEHSSVHWYQQCVTVHHVPVHELPQSHCGNNWGGTLLSRLHAIVAITGKVGGYIVFIALPVIYIYIYIYICNHKNNVPSRLSPQWLCDNLCTWAYDVRLHIAGTNEPKSAQQAKQGA